MSAFKVGQRVRILSHPDNREAGPHEGVIVTLNAGPVNSGYARPGVHHSVIVDDVPCRGRPDGGWLIEEYMLRPLADPKADAFIASVRSWGPLKEKPTYVDLVDSALAYIRGGSQ